MREWKLLLVALTIGSLGAASSAGAATATEDPPDYEAADAGALGVTVTGEVDVWCVVDAGSLGLGDPIAACR